MKDNYQILIERLDDFTRKYYVNQIIRGALYSVGLVLGLFLLFSLLESQIYFGRNVRKLMFWSFLGLSVWATISWMLVPALHYFRLGKVISREKAAEIIGSHFQNIQDKLLNILQLKEQSFHAEQKDLINASINQKTDEIKVVPFQAAIDLAQNKKYLKYALPPLFLLILLLAAAPSLIKDSTKRILQNDKEFKKPALFKFDLLNSNLKVVQFEDFDLRIKADGKVIPNDAFIQVNGFQYRMEKDSNGFFSYKFGNVQQDMPFVISSGDVISEEFKLEVLKKPSIANFEIDLDYPGYTGRSDETLSNIGDLVVPQGTTIKWKFSAKNTENVDFDFEGSKNIFNASKSGSDLFLFNRRAVLDESYKIFLSNRFIKNADSIGYSISVIPDLHPTIGVTKFDDSTNQKQVFFAGEASDDYGMVALTFNYKIKRKQSGDGQVIMEKIQNPKGKETEFNYQFDISKFDLKPGDEITYYFEVFDNDAINGSKSSKSNIMTFRMPTIEEFEQKEEKNNDEIRENLTASLKEMKKVQDNLEKLREKVLQQKEMDWQTKKELEKLLDKQKELQNNIEKAKKQFDENLKNQDEFKSVPEEIKEKQEMVQKMFDEMLNDEQKKLMKEMEEMLQQMQKENALSKMEEFKFSNEEMKMELDRMLEMFKQLEVENKLQEKLEKLDELAKKQDKLAEENELKKKENEELKQEQKELNKEFEKLKEEMKDLEKKNEELEQPKDLDDPEEKMEDIEKDMEESEKSLEKKESSKASKSQKSASKKMKNMANNMKMKAAAQEMEEEEEDLKAIRQLLENLVTLSFEQEGTMKNVGKAVINTPNYVGLIQNQFKIKDDFRLVEDSLHALSKRVFKIQSFVTEKVNEINSGMERSIRELEERNKGIAAEHQQRTMKGMNDLALMLAESMQQMQQAMAAKMDGNQQCNKPGKGKGKSGKVPMDKIGEGQKSINDQMKNMKERMEKGKSPSSMSKEMAQMAAKQAALRNALKELQKEKASQGKGSKELDQIMEEMNKIETDLVNKKLTNEMLMRQQDILTRLLENDKATRERDQDERRKGESADQLNKKLPPAMEEYLRKRRSDIEQINTVSPSLKPYYKTLVEDYLKKIKSVSPKN
jgi:hypothetical protein